MGKKLEKSNVLYERDENGELIPQERPLIIDVNDNRQKEYEGFTIGVIPMTRGEIRRMFGEVTTDLSVEKDKDGEIVTKYCKRPVFTEEEVAFAKPSLTSAIVNTVLFESGIDIRGSSKKEAVLKTEDDFAKNSEKPSLDE